MGRKCSVANCRSNYSRDTKETVYGFPLKNDEQLELWLSSLPNVIKKADVTRNMGVCRKHWPETTKMKTVNGKVIPATPPSIFTDCLPSFRRQTATSTSREVHQRQISAEARSRQEDELSEFERLDKIPDYSNFVSELTERGISHVHIIRKEESVHLLSFDSTMRDIEFSVHVSSNFHVTAFHRQTKVPLRDLLGFQCKLQRWSQLENIIARTRHYELSGTSEIEHFTAKFHECSLDDTCSEAVSFILEQLSLVTVEPKGRRYSATCMMIAFEFFLSSKATYNKIRKYLAMPSLNTLTQNIGPFHLSGSEEYSMRMSNLFFKQENNEQSQCTLIFDEIHLKPSLRYRAGHVLGYSCDDPEKLAKTALVFKIRMIFKSKPNSFVLRIVPIHRLTADLLYHQTLSLLRIISSAGGKVIALLSDNLSTNRKFHSLLRTNFPSPNLFKIPHPIDEGQFLYLLFDSVHLIKSIRNNWITEKSQEIAFTPPGKSDTVVAKWSDIADVYRSECQNPLKRTTLTSMALCPSNFDRQKVSLALQVFNDKTVAALSQDGKEETACFVYHMTRMWKILNVKSTTAHLHLNDEDRKPVSVTNRHPLSVLKEIWSCFSKMSIKRKRRLSLSAETSNSLLQTIDGLIDLCHHLLDDNSVQFVLLGAFQSDSLEGEFGAIRGMFGGLYHVALEQILIASKLRQIKLLHDLGLETKCTESTLHPASCCTDDFTEAEWSQIDNCFNFTEDVDQKERTTLFYIAGYLTFKEKLEAGDELIDVVQSYDSEFTRLVSRGKLKCPSEDFFYFTLICYGLFKNLNILCRRRLTRCFVEIYDSYFTFKCEKSLFSRLVNVLFSGFVRTESDHFSSSQKTQNDARKRKKFQ